MAEMAIMNRSLFCDEKNINIKLPNRKVWEIILFLSIMGSENSMQLNQLHDNLKTGKYFLSCMQMLISKARIIKS